MNSWHVGVAAEAIVKSRIEHRNANRKRGEASVNTEARGLFDDIESGVRFRYVKFSKCYNDIGKLVMAHTIEEALRINTEDDSKPNQFGDESSFAIVGGR